jgi:nitrate reductase gamma subunit
MRTLDVLLWVVLPYMSFASFVLGTIHRYRYDRAGWTTRASQLPENRLVQWGNPLLHAGILLVLGGHAAGLLIPASWTRAVGITGAVYHNLSVFLGTVAGVMALIGMVLLIARRYLNRAVRASTGRTDAAMYLVLLAVVALGILATLRNTGDGSHDYRETISPWFRSLFTLAADPSVMAGVPLRFQLHIVAAFVLIAIWPFTRLVHAVSAPIGYLTRPYVVHRLRTTSRS